ATLLERVMRLMRAIVSTHSAATPMLTRSLHDALPISDLGRIQDRRAVERPVDATVRDAERPAAQIFERQRPVVRALGKVTDAGLDRKSTRLNSSHVKISYAVFCLKKKTNVRPSPKSTA